MSVSAMVARGLIPVLVCLCVFWCLSETEVLPDSELGDVCKQSDGKNWTCKPVMNCPMAVQNLQENIKNVQCHFKTTEPIVCCEPLDISKLLPPPPASLTNSSSPPSPGYKSKQKCVEYAEYVSFKTPVFYKATKGKDAQPQEYPHMALIGYGEKDSIEWLCGGSLISRKFVISAAHCTDSGIQGLASWVRLGDYDVSTNNDENHGLAKAEDYEIIERIDHPDYQSPFAYNDISLYKLEREVQLNEFIRPICLHTGGKIGGNGFALATGWGSMGWLLKGSKVLQKVKLELKAKTVCETSYKAGPRLRDGIQVSSQFCAGDSINGADTCLGDSGGPIQVALDTPHAMYSLIGVTSFGGRPCGGNKPSVYTRVSNYIPWIENTVWPNFPLDT
ncbi:venom protease-like [Homalodisca vitripennis]|uniref:venom protease-like n=1 Tax=Homalodisca vitripennis TaxID=197043 RepID=UPI001EEB496F|nr:venom protease-like [Homalodisca vitripennis]